MTGFMERVKSLAPIAARYAGSTYPRAVDLLVSDLESVLSKDRVRYDGAERALLSHDASVFEGGVAGPVVFPETAEKSRP